MQSAPPGSVALNGCPAWRAAVVAVALAAVAALAGWSVGRSGGWLVPGLALLWAASVVVAAATLLRRPNGQLAWSADRWRFEPRPSGGPPGALQSTEGTIAVALDLGNVLLLTLHPDDDSLPPGLARAVARAFPRWLPVERAATAGDWHGLRVALAAAPAR